MVFFIYLNWWKKIFKMCLIMIRGIRKNLNLQLRLEGILNRSFSLRHSGYVSTNLTGWKDMMLKPPLIRALRISGFEHPSEVQHECIPYAVEGHDILCQAKSGMGKTAVFVLSILNQVTFPYQLIRAKEDTNP